jgi:hypothetical protein
MKKRFFAGLWCCIAALPLIGCAGGVTAAYQPALSKPTAVADYPARPSLEPAGPAVPAAILVVLPGAGSFASDPALWRSQGIDIVTPPATELYQLAAQQEAALAQMMASAQRLADARVWLMGPRQEIEATLAAPWMGSEQVSGVVETSTAGPAGTCSESFSYFDPGTGAKPQVKISKSGDCPPGLGFSIGGPGAGFGTSGPVVVPAAPPPLRLNAPRVIEASASPDIASPAAHRAAIERLAELIKAAPSS